MMESSVFKMINQIRIDNILAKIMAFLVLFFSLFSEADDISGPWTEIADLMKTRNYDGAIDKLNDTAKNASQIEDKAWLYFQIGSIYFEYKHEYKKAMDAFQKVLALKRSVDLPSSDLLDCSALSQMSIADVYRRNGEYDKAIKEYENIMDSYPNTRYAKIASHDIKGIKNALTEIETYKSFIDKHPDTDISADIQFEIAELYLSPQNLNNTNQAIIEYNKFIEKYPDNPKSIEALFKIADTYRSILRDPLNSIYSYKKILEKGSFASNLRAEAMFQIGIIYYSDLSDYIKACEVFCRFLEDYPVYWKYPAGVYWLAMCYEQIGDYDKAISFFELFIQLYPDDDSKLSADIGKLGERDVKSQIRAKVANLKKIAPGLQWSKAEKFVSSGNYRDALTIYRDLMSKYPNTNYAENSRIQANKIHYLAEIQMLRELIKNQPDEIPAIQYKIAEIYETGIQNNTQALKEYQVVVDKYSGTYWACEALFRIGFIYSSSGNMRLVKTEKRSKESLSSDTEKAIATYRQLIKEYPNSYRSAEAHFYLGEIYRIRLNDYQKALQEYQKVIDNYPEISFYEREGYKDSLADQAQFKIGRIYYENLKDNNKALQAFMTFLDKYPNSCRKSAIYSFIAVIQEANGDYNSAKQSLQTIMNLIVDSSVQSLYYIRDSISVMKISENLVSSSDHQDEIVRQIKQKISQISYKQQK